MLSKKEILDRLRMLREEKSMRQGHVARRLGIDRTTYVRKEQGAIPITTEEWLTLAQTMGLEPSYFFTCLAQPQNTPKTGEKERLLLKLYRSLSRDERSGLIRNIKAALKGVRRKTVQDTLERLKKI